MRRAAFIVMCVGFFAAGCEQERAEDAPICGGGGEGEMSFGMRMYGLNEGLPSESMLFENGSYYVVVKHDCSYIMWSSDNKDYIWSDIITGRINNQHHMLYNNIFEQIDWRVEDGRSYEENHAQYQGLWIFTHTGRSFSASCMDCQGGASVVRRVGELMEALREDGAPLEADAVWVRVIPLPTRLTDVTFESAPPGLELASLARWPSGDGLDEPISLVEGEAAAALLAQRARVRGLTRGEYPHRFLALRDADGAHYRVYVRPRSPMDGVDGRIVWE